MTQKVRAIKVHTLSSDISLLELADTFCNEPYLCLLESCGELTPLGRYSFLCTRPYYVFMSKRKQCFGGPPDNIQQLPGLPFEELSSLLGTVWSTNLHTIDSPFLSGAVGYLGYEMLYQLENIPDCGRDDHQVPDSCLFFSDAVFVSDKVTGKTSLVVSGFGSTASEAEEEAEKSIKRLLQEILPIASNYERRELPSPSPDKMGDLTEQMLTDLGIKCVMDRESYLKAIEVVKEYIRNGDVYEVCLTNRFEFITESTISGECLYEILRQINPAAFSAYLRFRDLEIISSSPENFLSVGRDGWVQSRPIKGTCPRGRSNEEDELLRNGLSASHKDRAENIMIVDLVRNDLGRVCEFGSVSVPELMVVEAHPFVHQLVSTVKGKLKKDSSTLDLIRAAFPGGSMTGAPKIAAMKIIDELEPVKRRIYSGCIGYIDFDRQAALSIVIRTLIKKGPHIEFHTGGAIVADSDPELEYEEILHKAKALVQTLQLANNIGSKKKPGQADLDLP